MKKRVILILTFVIAAAAGKAQNSQLLYFMNLPQNHVLNPALVTSDSWYIGIPGISGINVNLTNNFLSFSDLFMKGVEISKDNLAFLDQDFDRDKFLGSLRELNYIEPKASVQILSTGFKVGDGFFLFLDVSDNVRANVVFPKDLLRIAFLGNEAFPGQTFNLSDTRAEYIYYREIGAGVSKQVTPRLRFGGKAKLLFGITAGMLQNYGLNLTVGSDYATTLQANLAMDLSAPVNVYTDADGEIEDFELDDSRFDSGSGVFDFLANTKNAGFGVDLGAEFSLTDQIVVSAAITDVGFIKWKSDLVNLEAVSDIELSGLDFEDVYQDRASIDDVITSLRDSIRYSFRKAPEEKVFTTKLPVGLAIGGKYILNDRYSFGILSYSRITAQQIKQAVTLSANMNIRNSFHASLGYTACNHDYSNLGLGLAFRASVFQMYFLVDRIPLNWKKTGSGGETLTLPANWNTIHTMAGINLVFGNKRSNNL